jgi:hypothetical protein
MAFILITRSTTGSLRLLADTVFDSRLDALSTLSHITADPSFDDWASEVFLIDLDTTTPVLLIRPAVSLPMSEIETHAPQAVSSGIGLAEDTAADTGGANAWLADVETVPVADPTIAEAITQEATEGQDVTPMASAAPAREASGDEFRAALRRSTLQMRGEGVEVPVPVEPETSAQPSPLPDASTPVVPEMPEESAAPFDVPAVVEAIPVGRPRVSEVEENPETASAPTVEAPTHSAVPWPWDDPEVPVASESETPEEAPQPLAMESKGVPQDDEPQPLSAGVEVRAEAASESKPESASGAQTEEVAPPPATDDIGTPPSVDDIAAAPLADEMTSDFILDLDQPPSGQPMGLGSSAVLKPGIAQPDVPLLEEYVCADCAYVETCPNKDQRLPKDCGSFQWR